MCMRLLRKMSQAAGFRFRVLGFFLASGVKLIVNIR